MESLSILWRSNIALLIALSALLLPPSASPAETNILIIPKDDKRAGAVFFIDECLTRGLTNSISLKDLRKWATNTILNYQGKEFISKGVDSVPGGIRQ